MKCIWLLLLWQKCHLSLCGLYIYKKKGKTALRWEPSLFFSINEMAHSADSFATDTSLYSMWHNQNWGMILYQYFHLNFELSLNFCIILQTHLLFWCLMETLSSWPVSAWFYNQCCCQMIFIVVEGKCTSVLAAAGWKWKYSELSKGSSYRTSLLFIYTTDI